MIGTIYLGGRKGLGGVGIGSLSGLSVPSNQAPNIAVPGSQSATSNVALAITGTSIADADGNTQTVTLTASHGTMTLASTTGLSFSAGDGTADATMTFSGSVTNINTAIATITYTSTTDYVGADSLAISTNDGAGGTDSDSIAITVTFTPASVSSLFRWLDIGGGTGMYSDAGSTVAVANDPVYRLAARNDAAKYLDQSTLANRPILKQGANGIWYLEPDGTNDYLQTASGTIAQTNTIAFVWIPSGAAGGNNNDERVVDGGSGTRQIIDGTGLSGSKVWRYFAGSLQSSATAYSDATAYRVIAKFAGASSKLLINGVSASTANPSTGSITGLTLFSDNAGSSSVAAGGKLSQYCDFSAALSASEESALDTWLATQVPT